MELSFNKCYQNGINGVVVHKTHRVLVKGNTVWDNGQVSKELPDDRQAYAGITLNHAEDVSLVDNHVAISDPTDTGFVLVSGSTFNEDETGNNTICNGKVNNGYGDRVEILGEGCELDLSEPRSYLEGKEVYFAADFGQCGRD